MTETLLFYDFETFGTDVRSCRPVQFGAIRTDLDLNPVEEPINILCKPAPDFLPSPVSCSIHGITPQYALEHGVSESEFAGLVYAVMSRPGTCSVGYNSMSFDSKVARFLFWRNFLPAYRAEYDNGCSKWDIKTLAEAAFALRPQGINWPAIDGMPSLRLEHLSKENGLNHESAHDALSDVRATLAFAQLIRDKQPRLFDYSFSQRRTNQVEHFVEEHMGKVVIHVSPFYGYNRNAVAPVLLVCKARGQSRMVLGIDLGGDLSSLHRFTAEELREQLYTKAEHLDEGQPRPPLVSIRTNEGPFIAPYFPALAPRLTLGQGRLDSALAALPPLEDLEATLQAVFRRDSFPDAASPDEALYDGFVSDADAAQMAEVRRSAPDGLSYLADEFRDGRLNELFLLYRGRHFPDSLDRDHLIAFGKHCQIALERDLEAFERELSEVDAQLAAVLQQYARSIGVNNDRWT